MNVEDIKGLKPKIKPLVSELIRLDVETVWSCEGNNNWGDKFPWVAIALKDLDKAKKLVNLYNKMIKEAGREDEIFWITLDSPAALMPDIKNKKIPLEKLQENALRFAEFISNLNEIPETDMSSNAYC